LVNRSGQFVGPGLVPGDYLVFFAPKRQRGHFNFTVFELVFGALRFLQFVGALFPPAQILGGAIAASGHFFPGRVFIERFAGRLSFNALFQYFFLVASVDIFNRGGGN